MYILLSAINALKMTNAPFVMLGQLGNMNRSQCDVNWKKHMVSVCGKCLLDLCRGLLVRVSYHATYHVVSGRSCALLPRHPVIKLNKKQKKLAWNGFMGQNKFCQDRFSTRSDLYEKILFCVLKILVLNFVWISSHENKFARPYHKKTTQ